MLCELAVCPDSVGYGCQDVVATIGRGMSRSSKSISSKRYDALFDVLYFESHKYEEKHEILVRQP